MMHDNIITGYSVDLEGQCMTIHTCRTDGLHESISFSGVLTHYFQDALSGSIILDIYERALTEFVDDNIDQLLDRAPYGWPVLFDSMEQLQQKLEDSGCRYYIIASSYGLSGWVLAREYSIEE